MLPLLSVAYGSVNTFGRNSRIFVAGHAGLVGAALMRRLEGDGYTNLLRAARADLDLRNQAAVDSWFSKNKPEFVFICAGTVGGILANSTRPAEFLYDNLMIHANLVEASRQNGVEKLLYLGSSCIYPRNSRQPIAEDQLLTGPLEPTNEGYALAKISGIKLCDFYRSQHGCNFISAMPTNLYGPHDNFDLQGGHVLPALIRKVHEAKVNGSPPVEIWGSGTPRREFLHVDDLADACLHLIKHYDQSGHVNIGTGEDLSIEALAMLVRDVVFPDAKFVFDASKPDGMPRKILDVSKLHALGWRHRIELRQGIESTYRWFCASDPDDVRIGVGSRVRGDRTWASARNRDMRVKAQRPHTPGCRVER